MNDGPHLAFLALARGLVAPFVRLHVWHASTNARAATREARRPAVLVANHISHFDPPLISLALHRPIDWMTSREFYSNRFLGAWLRLVNTFPVDRTRLDRQALRVGVERLRTNRLVGVFPDGGIRAGETSILGGASPKRGATTLARLSGAPIVPAIIYGSDRLYARRAWLPGFGRTPVWIAVGEPFAVPSVDGDSPEARLARALRDLADACITHFDLGPADLPATPQHRKGIDARTSAVDPAEKR